MAVVLMTGASGLVGRHVSARWHEASDLVAPTREENDLRSASNFIKAIQEAQADVVLHLAWTASGTPDYRTSPDNAALAASTAEAARWCAARSIRFIATGTVLDDRPGTDAYTTAKQALRCELADLISTGGVTWLRPFYVFDEASGRPALVDASLRAAARGQKVALQHPVSRHDFVHAADVATAINRVVHEDLRQVVEIGSGSLHSVADVAEACGAEWLPGAPDDAMLHDDRVADVRALLDLGWRPHETERFFAP